jgi:hypothetical protein
MAKVQGFEKTTDMCKCSYQAYLTIQSFVQVSAVAFISSYSRGYLIA